MRNANDVYVILNNIFESNPNKIMGLYKAEIIDEGIINRNRISQIISGTVKLEDVPNAELCLLYTVIYNAKIEKIPEPDTFFSEVEIDASKVLNTDDKNLNNRFKILAYMNAEQDSFLMCLSIQEINELKSHRKIKWVEGMQRESVIVKYGNNNLISHIKFSQKRMDQISQEILNGTFYPNSLRWHILNNSCEYHIEQAEDGEYFVLDSGFFAEIDGQHRDRATEIVLVNQPEFIMNFPIVVSIGNVKKAQHIISQDEKRAPISKTTTYSYQSTHQNNIIELIVNNDDIDPIIKFTNNIMSINNRTAYILQTDISKAINKYYNMNNINRKEEKEIAEWIVEVFNYTVTLYTSELINYRSNNGWAASTEFFYGIVYLSSLYRNYSNWEDKIKNALDKAYNPNKRMNAPLWCETLKGVE